jgi:hypothetical protein
MFDRGETTWLVGPPLPENLAGPALLEIFRARLA